MSQQQTRPPDTGLFIVAVAVGLIAGGTLLTLVTVLLGLAISSALSSATHDATLVAFVFCYGIVVAIGALAFFLVRRNVGFLSGFVVGATAGLLGGVALCNGLIGGLNNMH